MFTKMMIPVAAFAVTATAASAFNADLLEELDINLSDTQISALEEAHELKEAGAEKEEIKEVLEDAGIDRETMQEIRAAKQEHRQERREAVQAAFEAEDYDAFVDAVGDSPRGEVIDSEADFLKLVEAHELREAGDKEGARAILDELGIERPEGKRGEHKGPNGQNQ